jgi:hypothetical protein
MFNRILTVSVVFSVLSLHATAQESDVLERFKEMSTKAEEKGLAEPYRGIVVGGKTEEGLFPVQSTGVTTGPIRVAADALLLTLTAEQRERTQYPVDDPEWRKWMNQHFYVRQGVSFEEMTEAQREAAFGLLESSLSARGMTLSRDIMRLNHTLGELRDNNFIEFGEWLYSITIMGEPSATEPWGWQLDGHHLIINFFILGDQVVMSPSFFGSEPVLAESGKYEGTVILQEEQNMGLAFMNSLTEEQQAIATLSASKDGNNNLGEAFSDNLDIDLSGIPASELSESQRASLMDLIGLYVGNMEDGHAAIKMQEVAEHIDDTQFTWIGDTDEGAVFYYRVLSPVILIEFDHQRPANLRHLYPPVPNRQHIHSVIRTPNGNDYGKDLLRQHYEAHEH